MPSAPSIAATLVSTLGIGAEKPRTGRWRRFAHEVAFARQLAFGVSVLELFGDNEQCRRQERAIADMPAGTVGHALHRFMTRHGFRLVPGYQRHDLKHVILGFATDAPDEMRMQAFMTGNAGFGFESFLALSFLPWTPDMWADIPREILAGRHAGAVGGMDFDETVARPLHEVQAEVGLVRAYARADRTLARWRRRR